MQYVQLAHRTCTSHIIWSSSLDVKTIIFSTGGQVQDRGRGEGEGAAALAAQVRLQRGGEVRAARLQARQGHPRRRGPLAGQPTRRGVSRQNRQQSTLIHQPPQRLRQRSYPGGAVVDFV